MKHKKMLAIIMLTIVKWSLNCIIQIKKLKI